MNLKTSINNTVYYILYARMIILHVILTLSWAFRRVMSKPRGSRSRSRRFRRGRPLRERHPVAPAAAAMDDWSLTEWARAADAHASGASDAAGATTTTALVCMVAVAAAAAAVLATRGGSSSTTTTTTAATIAATTTCLTAAVIAVVLAAVHLYCRCVLGGYTRRLPLPAASLHGSAAPLPQKSDAPVRAVLVTGGCGFLGWTIVKQLTQQTTDGKKTPLEIIVVDLALPHFSRRVAGVTYVVGDLARDDPSLDLTELLAGCDAVVHTAGLVDLTADHARTYNAHVIGTARLMAAARQSPRCRCMVTTSSVGAITSPYVTSSQLNLPVDFVPPEMRRAGHPSAFPFFSAYSWTKFFAERMTLAANQPEDNFRTLAIRLPMIFGLQDPMVVAPLFKGQREYVPDGKGALVEFVYIENAAAIHVHALLALCSETEAETTESEKANGGISGRVFNGTNGDAARDAVETWNVLVARANDTLGLDLPMMKTVPFGIMFAVASAVEGVFALCCGHVPFRRNAVWNFTRASLRHSCTSVTQSMDATVRDLGFRPKFSTYDGFDQMLLQLKSPPAEQHAQSSSSIMSSPSPLDRIDWGRTPAGNVSVFDRMSGPGMTGIEAAVTALGMVGGMWLAWQARLPTWSQAPVGCALFFALINASAVVQCTTPTSKRWYHQGGRLEDRLCFVIAFEVLLLAVALHGVFSADHPTSFWAGALSRGALLDAGGLVASVLLTHYAPLPIQRAVGVLCACAGIAACQARRPLLPGMEWAPQLLYAKYCVSHVPRHEPYA